MTTAVGFVAKTGWAVAVVLDGTDGSPTVIERRRLDLLEPETPGHVFHAASELPLADATRLVARVTAEAERGARRGLERLVAEHGVERVGLVAAAGHVPHDLAAILASHLLLHAAEAELVRHALEEAAAGASVPVVRTRKKELTATAERVLGVDEVTLQARLSELGRAVGAPWRQEQKDAALAAWLALAS